MASTHRDYVAWSQFVLLQAHLPGLDLAEQVGIRVLIPDRLHAWRVAIAAQFRECRYQRIHEQLPACNPSANGIRGSSATLRASARRSLPKRSTRARANRADRYVTLATDTAGVLL